MQIVLQNSGNFEVSFKYHPDMITLIRKIPGRTFDPKTKVWNVPGESEQALRQIAEIVGRFQFVDWKREEQVDPNDNQFFIKPLPELTVPHGLNFDPRPYQGPGIARGLELKRFMNADDPGSGKTFQSIGTVHIAKAFPCLVICPGNVKIHWQREWMKYSSRKALILNDDIRNSWPFYIKQNLADIFIVNFESLLKYFVRGIRTKKGNPIQFNDIIFNPAIDYFESVIVDESQRVKDWSAQQTKFVTGIADGISETKEFKIELTGTPILNRYIDLIPQLRIMDRLNDMGGDRNFKIRYCAGPNKASNGRELRVKLWNTCMFRRTKAEIKKDLPPVTRQIMTCEITNRREYEFAKKDLTNYLKLYKDESNDRQKNQMKKVAWQKINVLEQISAKGKVKAVVEHARDFLASGKKLIIYAELHDVVDALVKAFPKAVLVTGRQDSIEKQRSIDAFGSNPRVNLCIISAAGGTGTDGLQHQCSDIDLIQHPWHDPGCIQIESRVDRDPQTEPVTARYWQGENTVDEKKWRVVETKKKLIGTVMDSGDQVSEDNITDMAIEMFMEDME